VTAPVTLWTRTNGSRSRLTSAVQRCSLPTIPHFRSPYHRMGQVSSLQPKTSPLFCPLVCSRESVLEPRSPAEARFGPAVRLEPGDGGAFCHTEAPLAGSLQLTAVAEVRRATAGPRFGHAEVRSAVAEALSAAAGVLTVVAEGPPAGIKVLPHAASRVPQSRRHLPQLHHEVQQTPNVASQVVRSFLSPEASSRRCERRCGALKGPTKRANEVTGRSVGPLRSRGSTHRRCGRTSRRNKSPSARREQGPAVSKTPPAAPT
jgi:hypothetical protein